VPILTRTAAIVRPSFATRFRSKFAAGIVATPTTSRRDLIRGVTLMVIANQAWRRSFIEHQKGRKAMRLEKVI
jgi:hypothetical protein